MKKLFLLSAIAVLTIVGCSEKVDNSLQSGLEKSGELAMSPVSVNEGTATRGYVETGAFEETYCSDLHSSYKPAAKPRTMQMSSYLYPQNGNEGNYFVDETFAKGSDNFWHANPAIYWPVGGKLDFLAFSLTTESQYNKGITVKWDSDNAAQQVVLTVPAENTQNDILYASASNVKAQKSSAVLPMQFKHAQAWLEFVLTGTVDADQPVVHLKGIEIEDVYNAGTLTINNNGGVALAQWDFAGQKAQNIFVDNVYDVFDLKAEPQYMDMLIPQQPKTSFVIYYTLGTDDQELSYRFTTDQMSWLMGEKYIYRINVNANEITVKPEVSAWNATTSTESTITVTASINYGTVTVENLETGDIVGPSYYQVATTCSTWGAQVKLTAEIPNDYNLQYYRFEKWSDGSTENPHIVTVTGDATYEAIFTDQGPVVSAYSSDPALGYATINGKKIFYGLKVAPGETVTIEAIEYIAGGFQHWSDGPNSNPRVVTVFEDSNYEAIFADKSVEIAGVKWATENLAITASGKRKIYDTNHIIGDYFQWAAYPGYCGSEDDPDKGLLVYKSFTSTFCWDGTNGFTFKKGKGFDNGSAPYYDGYSSFTNYKTGDQTLVYRDDAARQVTDGYWRIPTKDEFQSLIDNTFWAWDASDRGYYVFSPTSSYPAGGHSSYMPYNLKKENAILFVPALGNGNEGTVGKACWYWSSTSCAGQQAYTLNFSVEWGNYLKSNSINGRATGFPIRPVKAY